MGAGADDRLRTYREKRDFEATAEPSGTSKRRRSGDAGLAFCVQKHDATRLHYDFRVEWQGVLKSWAVTRGPSLDPADKRLAVRTEDHPLDYGDFEGTIPADQYGGGTVMLWDRGIWEPEPGTDPETGLAAGNLKMVLRGEKMNGRWALIRMKPRAREKRENWLLIKEKDATADPGADLLASDRSIKTGRGLKEIAAGAAPRFVGADGSKSAGKASAVSNPPARTAKAKGVEPPAKTTRPARSASQPLSVPAFRPPQLATLVDAPPEGAGWIHEMKYDGYRVLVALGGGVAKLFTRSGLDWTDRFGALRPAMERLACRSALIDGEVVAFDGAGRTDFSTLQARLKNGGPLSCFCFDLLELDGVDLAAEPLSERKARLQNLLSGEQDGTLLFSEHVAGRGKAVLDEICKAGHEGIVSKRADAPYRAGRGSAWLKTKCTRRQEFVIGGYSVSDKKGRPFSSILVGVKDGDRLVYRGRVGSGFDDRTLDDLAESFDSLASATSPFADLPAPIRRTARFVKPTLVAEIDFAEITADGQIRHGVFKGLRADKKADEVTGEGAMRTTPTPQKPSNRATSRPDPASRSSKDAIAGIALSHADRVVFPGITKGDIAAYYEAVSERMLVHAGRHALSLVRCPKGPKQHCFFQKHDSGGFPDAIRKVPIAEKDGGTEDYLFVEDAAGLVGCVQMNALEFHVWGSRIDRIETPDRMVFDLDPDEGLGFGSVREAAGDVRNILNHLGLESYALVTGGKGIHVVAPLTGRQSFDVVKDFARTLATKLADGDPARFVATMSKAKRRGRIFIDWLRNERGATAIAPYSTRARDGAPVATPVSWKELDTLEAANTFRISDITARLNDEDPWAAYGTIRQSLTKPVLARLARL
ncbi:ATP-dependent DNA ligase [Aureimonas sp. Leaf454]|uniref:DNA ligase D n=1 Tax=Aureimonas sp. Leaf454 TaxID=1736381 RepID=UPI0006FF8914|nr:DNA ligase D [Aureimonas sp. Leaf454]KQT54218.1 ATP-dependent DNA ligase [Aureimonas sp. Leaf454]